MIVNIRLLKIIYAECFSSSNVFNDVSSIKPFINGLTGINLCNLNFLISFSSLIKLLVLKPRNYLIPLYRVGCILS